jgi:CPA1 family monovalent cation:H+ antiporter
LVSTELIVTAFLSIALLASIVSKKTRTPYTILLVLIGIALSAISNPSFSSVAAVFQTLSVGGLFVGLILPPLLFESMMSIRVEEFRAVSMPALTLATGGVVIATVVGGLILWKFAGLPIYGAFLFAALIAPTDVATVLEIFGRTKVPARLATLMETESVFNDATGITLFTVLLTSLAASGLALLGAISSFMVLFGGGVLVGLLVAWGARQLQRETAEPVPQIVLTLAAVYGSYGLATSLGVSGLIAVAVTGLFYGNTVLFRIERKDTEQITRQFWSVLAFLANTVAFLFIGVSTNIVSLAGSFGVILIAYGVVVVARFASVYPILSIRGIAGPNFPWSWKNVAMLGGMRGALSIALVATIPLTMPGHDIIVNMTFGVAIISILVQGPLLTAYSRRAFGRQQTLLDASEEPPKPTLPASNEEAHA